MQQVLSSKYLNYFKTSFCYHWTDCKDFLCWETTYMLQCFGSSSGIRSDLFFEREGARVVRIVWKHSCAWPSSHAGGTLLSNQHSVLVQIYPPLACSHCQPVRSVFMFVAWIQLSMTCNIACTFFQCYRHRLLILSSICLFRGTFCSLPSSIFKQCLENLA